MGDELMGLIQANKTEHPIALSYIENEKANFVFGCTTKLKIEKYYFVYFIKGKLIL